jgi:hypothetical protein
MLIMLQGYHKPGKPIHTCFQASPLVKFDGIAQLRSTEKCG